MKYTCIYSRESRREREQWVCFHLVGLIYQQRFAQKKKWFKSADSKKLISNRKNIATLKKFYQISVICFPFSFHFSSLSLVLACVSDIVFCLAVAVMIHFLHFKVAQLRFGLYILFLSLSRFLLLLALRALASNGESSRDNIWQHLAANLCIQSVPN